MSSAEVKDTLPALDLCLLQMPYSTPHNPSIGLGLLKAYAEQRGIRTKVLYPVLDWADEVGLDIFMPIQRSSVNDQLGEWTFASAAFPDYKPDKRAYYDLAVRSINSADLQLISKLHGDADLETLMDLLRLRAKSFIDRMARKVLATGARIVGCSSVFQQQMASLAVLRRIKELAPEVVTVLGGANCEGEMGLSVHRNFDWVDIVVSGEADGFFADLCELLLEKGVAVEASDLPYGVLAPCHRGALDGGYPDSQRAVVKNMDDTLVPDYDDYFEALEGLQNYDQEGLIAPGLLVETSRGCWWGEKSHCTFCGLNGAGMAFRAKSPERALADFQEVVDRYGIRRLECVDNILDMRYFKSVLPAMAEMEEPYYMFYEVKPNLRQDQLKELAAAGIRWLQPGIESLDDRILGLLAKGGTGIRNIQLLKWSQELGVRLAWGFLHGVPGEDDEWYSSMAEWLPALSHLQPPSGFARIRYDRFSPYHMHPETYGIELSPLDIYRHIYPLPQEELAKLVYFFEDYGDLGRGPIDPTRGGTPREGLTAISRAIGRWKQDFWMDESGPPVFEIVSDEEETLRIRDTRKIAVAEEHLLEGLARRVFIACEKGIPAKSIVRQVSTASGEDLSWEQLQPIVDDLVDKHLVLHIFDRFLSLAVRAPTVGFLSDEYVPEGYTNSKIAIRVTAGRSLARLAQKEPMSQSLVELFG